MSEAAFLLIILCVLVLPVKGQPWWGSGTEGDPYLIEDADDMQAIGTDWSYWGAHFKLINDINLAGFTGNQFNIIGTGWDHPFTGVFDGNGYKIYNFRYGPIASDDHVGIFGMVGNVNGAGGEIKNLGLIDPNIDVLTFTTGGLAGRLVQGVMSRCYVEGGSVSGDGFVGGLVGSSGYVNAEITNCYANASVSGDWPVGGLLGSNDGTVSDCYATGNVVGNSRIGGLVGGNEEYGPVSNCYATGTVQGADETGGLAGRNWGGTISNCYATGNVSGDSDTGGLVGQNSGANGHTATISNSYAVGDVDGYFNAGGLVGCNVGFLDPGEVTHCYSVGAISGDTGIGGLIGHSFAGSVVDSFWDEDTSNQGNSAGGTPKPTSQMQTESTFTNAGWDFAKEAGNGADDYWTICDGQDYPRLKWQFLKPDFDICVEGVDWKDFAYFANFWLDQPCEAANDYCYTADLDGKGSVDANDLAIVSDFWLEGV
ncbi:MAG: GLUG motif-containing protein [Planctomycetota bacterium]